MNHAFRQPVTPGRSARSLKVPNQLTALDDIQELIEELAYSWELPQKLKLELNLVLEELVTNIIKYGYEDQLDHTIDIEFACDPEKMTITISDDARAFDPHEYNPHYDMHKPLKERSVGGVGLHLVKTLMDTVSYRRSGDRNILVVSKNL